ncbi:hypothetical protein [Rhizobium sp. RAF56]|uniref:hypothetical protein n=1 Tax=Rhizobium sp. RAF56 TaxID=3233062 RepID=UPI003F972D74
MTDKAANDARRKMLGERAVLVAEQFAFPPTEWEAKTLAEVLSLPRVHVMRPPREELLAAGMVERDCHRNCSVQVTNDPDRSCRHVVGWLIHGSDLILHSVVEWSGYWLCLTPQLVAAPSEFQFIPDPLIEWVETRIGMEAFRGGVAVPHALRKYPEHHLLLRDKFHELLDSGISAYDARQIVDTTLGEELRKNERIIA